MAGLKESDLGDTTAMAKIRQVDTKSLVDSGVGAETITDIIASLQHPGRDLRDSMAAPILRTDVLTMADLK